MKTEQTVEPTEGEWTFYDSGVDDNGERDAAIVSQNGYSVARCPRYQTAEQWQADAKLIIVSKKMASLLHTVFRNKILTKGMFMDEYKDEVTPLLCEISRTLTQAGVYIDGPWQPS